MTWRLICQSFIMGFLIILSQIILEARFLTEEVDLSINQPVLLSLTFLVRGLAISGSIWVSGLLFDRRRFFDFGFKFNRRWWIDFCFGLALGIILMTSIFLFELAVGWIQITDTLVTSNPDSNFPTAILIPLILFLSVGFYEELFSRGYQLTNLAEGFSGKLLDSRVALLLATTLSSVAFGLMHAANPNSSLMSTLNICLAGLFLSVGYIFTGQLAIPIGLHISWNFFQGNVFGFPVSGGDFRSASFIQIQQFGPDLWTGGAFGPEGGLLGTIFTILGVFFSLAWIYHRIGKLRLQTEISEPPRGKWRFNQSKLQTSSGNLLVEEGDGPVNLSHQYSHIIWDWNGTLLDDLQLCLKVINSLLSKRRIPKVSKERYLEIFGFPVQDYYQKLGFDFAKVPYEKVSTEFINAYESGRPDCLLMSGTWETLKAISSLGITQSILSASKHDYLEGAILDYGLDGIFCAINGLDNHHAAGKENIAKTFMLKSNLDPRRTILIGDTIHDAEIAREINVDCWLIPNGHQSHHRLSKLNLPLIDSLFLVSKLISKSGNKQ